MHASKIQMINHNLTFNSVEEEKHCSKWYIIVIVEPAFQSDGSHNSKVQVVESIVTDGTL